MFTICDKRSFANGVVYALETTDGFPIEVTDTFLPYYTKDAVGTLGNSLRDKNDFGSRQERWMVGVSTMSGCPVRCAFCLLPESKIQTIDYRYKQIKNIKVGDLVVSNQLTKASNGFSDYASLYSTSAEVTEVFNRQYDGDIVVIKTKSGNVLRCTLEHPIAVKRKLHRKKFIPASDVIVGDSVLSCRNLIEKNHSWNVGWLVGFIEGDGVYSKNTDRYSYRTSVSQTDRSVLEFCRSTLIDLGIITSKIWNNGNGNGRFSFGQESFKKLLDIESSVKDTDDFVKGFIAGFWDAEGFKFAHNMNYRVCNTDIHKLERVSDYLIRFGFNPRIELYESKKEGETTKDCFVLESDMPRAEFCARFGPIHPKAIYLDSSRSKTFSYLDEVVSVDVEKYTGDVFNIETSTKTYFANDVLVHNCATAKLGRFRCLSYDEIVGQVEFIIENNPSFKFTDAKEHKVNYTRMGEPFLNIEHVRKAIEFIDRKYPGTHHYISTIGLEGSDFSWIKDNITLQVSLHSLDESRRDKLIPIRRKMSIKDLGSIRTQSNLKTTVNLTMVDLADWDINKLREYFDPEFFFIKVSPINPNAMSEENGMGTGIIKGTLV
jgi:hypothetical protein